MNSVFQLLLLSQLAELRQECEARGLETKGNKGELIARLQAYLEEHGQTKSPHIVTHLFVFYALFEMSSLMLTASANFPHLCPVGLLRRDK